MANSTSKFVQLTDFLLVEYRYTDLISPEVLNYNFTKIVNGNQSNQIQLLNVDAAIDVTGNTQDRAVIQVSGGKYADLDKDQVPTYLQYDTNLTTSTLVAATWGGIKYDTVRFHLLSGYNFEDLDGVIVQIEATSRNVGQVVLAAVAFLKDSVFFEFNARPIFLGDRLYDRFFDIKVASIKLENDDFYSFPDASPAQEATFAARVTETVPGNGKAFTRAQPLKVSAIEIKSTTVLKVAGARYKMYQIGSIKTVGLNQSDEFSLLSAVIQPSTAGDYFEYFASWDGGFIEDFLLNANSLPGNSYIVIHELRVFEQVGSLYKQTATLQSIQESGFDTPNLFRPILLNADKDLSYTIEYTSRLYNKANNSQVIRVASRAFYDPKSWGRDLPRLKLLNEAESFKIFNKVVDGPVIQNQAFIQNAQPVNTPITTRFVPSFFDRSTITLSKDSIFVDSNGKLQAQRTSSAKPVFGQGDLNVVITPFDNFFKFTILKTEGVPNSQPVPLDLGGSAEYFMVFIDNQGKKLRFAAVADASIGDPSKGDVVFKVPESDAEKILTFTTKEFWIVSRFSTTGVETQIYQGLFNTPQQIQDVKAAEQAVQTNAVQSVETRITDIETKQSDIVTQQNAIKLSTPTAIAIKTGVKVEIPGMTFDVPGKAITSVIASIVPRSQQVKSAATLATDAKMQIQAKKKNA